MRCRLCKKRVKKGSTSRAELSLTRGDLFKAKNFHRKCWRSLVHDFMSPG